jgi:hypothetical protein
MTLLAWILTSSLFVLYLVLLFTVCVLTFQKGYTVLGLLGIVLPFLWVIGALLPAKAGSAYYRKQAMRGHPRRSS